MRKDAEAHAEEDTKRARKRSRLRNEADNAGLSLREDAQGQRRQDLRPTRSKIEKAVTAVQEALKGSDADADQDRRREAATKLGRPSPPNSTKQAAAKADSRPAAPAAPRPVRPRGEGRRRRRTTATSSTRSSRSWTTTRRISFRAAIPTDRSPYSPRSPVRRDLTSTKPKPTKRNKQTTALWQ